MVEQGKRVDQKLKTYLVMQYLLCNTDERHPALRTVSFSPAVSQDRASVRLADNIRPCYTVSLYSL